MFDTSCGQGRNFYYSKAVYIFICFFILPSLFCRLKYIYLKWIIMLENRICKYKRRRIQKRRQNILEARGKCSRIFDSNLQNDLINIRNFGTLPFKVNTNVTVLLRSFTFYPACYVHTEQHVLFNKVSFYIETQKIWNFIYLLQ